MKLANVPRGLDEIIDVYGDPRDDQGNLSIEWYYAHTAIYKLPFKMQTWNKRTTDVFRAHVMVGVIIEHIMHEIATRLTVGYMKQAGWDFWGGCWWFRPMRGYDALSTHAWGIACDINPIRAPQGGKPGDQHQTIARCFEEAGFVWGGRWSKPYVCDPMHFQAARGY